MGRSDGKARMRSTGFAPARPARQTHAAVADGADASCASSEKTAELVAARSRACSMQQARVCAHIRRPTAEPVASLLPCSAKPSQAKPSQAKPSVRTSACARARACTWVRVMEPRASHRLCERVERRSGERSPGADGGSGARGSCARIEPSGAARPCRAGAEQPVPPVTAVTARTLNSNTLNSNALNL